MRIAIAGFALESVSFLPALTGRAEFERAAVRGADMIAALADSASVGGGFIEVLRAADAEIVPLVYTDCSAAGPASDEAFEVYCREICDGLAAEAGRLDGVLLFLHGAMTTPARDDPEGELLRRLRAVVGPELPVMVALDLHGNLTAEMVALTTACFGFHYSPHTDMRETGARAARCLVATLRGEIAPTVAFAKVPLALPSIFTATALAPLSDLVAAGLARQAREARLLDLSIFTGFAYADVPQVGASIVAVGDGDRDPAERAAQDLARQLWAARHALLHRELVHGLDDGIERALTTARRAARPVVVLEHADRLCDSTWVLKALKARGGVRAAIPYLWDPRAAQLCLEAGAGATVTLDVGGHSSTRAGGPLRLTAKVRFAGPKSYVGSGPMRRGRRIDLGLAALLEADGLLLSLTSTPEAAIDADPFEVFGLDPLDFELIVLRSKTHFRAVYQDLAAEIVIVDTPDWGPADLTGLPYRKVGPGVFPITTQE